MSSFAYSATYGSVALGPVQRDVLAFVHSMTEDGRRPELTLRAMAALTGHRYQSVHNALERLRALGLIGVAAQPGRHGGHRLWRVARVAGRTLDRRRHRAAIARIARRWFSAPALTPTPARAAQDRPVPDPRSGAPSGSSAQLELDGADHPYATKDDRPRPCPVHGCTRLAWGRELCHVHAGEPESFAERMRRHGIGAWVDEKRHK